MFDHVERNLIVLPETLHVEIGMKRLETKQTVKRKKAIINARNKTESCKRDEMEPLNTVWLNCEQYLQGIQSANIKYCFSKIMAILYWKVGKKKSQCGWVSKGGER